jgi:predicted ATPase/DNA-binding SARP family transcriptional activator
VYRFVYKIQGKSFTTVESRVITSGQVEPAITTSSRIPADPDPDPIFGVEPTMTTQSPSPHLSLDLLGPFAVSVEGHPLPRLRTRKGQWLLALLILRHPRPVERAWLAGTLWPESTEAQSLFNLRHCLNNLRQALGGQACRIHSVSKRALMLDLSGAKCDLLTFDAALKRGDPASLQEAVGLYRGPLLEGCFEEWVFAERRAREQALLNALEKLAEQASQSGEAQAAVGYLQRAVAVDPLLEHAQCLLLQALASSGDYAEATQSYRAFRLLLSRELNAEPSTETTALYRQILTEARRPVALPDGPARRGAPAGTEMASSPREPADGRQRLHPDLSGDLPSRRALPTTVRHLPHTHTSFIGREQEIIESEALLLRPDVRLLTITGFGGMGKSRLAMEVAERCLPAFPEGVWWLEMEEARSGQAMFKRIAERLKLPMQATANIPEQIGRALRERSLLLALDNLEQAPDAAEGVRALLEMAPGLKCLVTSRRILALYGEHVLELRPLPEADAETLFVHRVCRQQPEFALSQDNRTDVAELCRRLEGVPLAIELAAARAPLLTPRQILSRLNRQFPLLRSRTLDLPPRQRALYATIEWSYGLLPEPERAVFAQLAVFAGGFTLDDTEAVCKAEDVIESLETLRRHSFFRIETDVATQETRLTMLDSVREYAAEKLCECDEGEAAARRRHAERFLGVAQARLARRPTAREATALRELAPHIDNLRAAEQWAREAGVMPLAAELALALGRWQQRNGFLQEAVARIQDGLDALCPLADTRATLCAALLRERAGLHLDFGETADARACAEQARALCAAQDEAGGQANAENLLGQAAMQERRFPEARQRFARALKQFTREQNTVEMAVVQNNLGLVERRDRSGSAVEMAARREKAEQHLQEALRLRRSLDDRRGLAETLNNLGVLAQERDDLAVAWDYYIEALTYEQEVRNTLGAALLLANLGEVAQTQGDSKRAYRLLAVSERLLEAVQSPLEPVAVVGEMLRKAAVEAGFGPEALVTLRTRTERLSSEECVAFALHADPDMAPGEESQIR